MPARNLYRYRVTADTGRLKAGDVVHVSSTRSHIGGRGPVCFTHLWTSDPGESPDWGSSDICRETDSFQAACRVGLFEPVEACSHNRTREQHVRGGDSYLVCLDCHEEWATPQAARSAGALGAPAGRSMQGLLA